MTEVAVPQKRKRTRLKKTDRDYVDNKKFSQALVEYIIERDEALSLEEEPPIVPDYIASCIVKISQRLSNSHNFKNYVFKDEMISDGIENCIRAVQNYNKDAYTRTGTPNAFGYFTKIAYYAFIRRIQYEKKILYIKYKASMQKNILNETSVSQYHDESSYNNDISHTDNMNEFIKNYEESILKKKS